MADITDFDIGQGESFKILAHIYAETSGSEFLDITDYSLVGHIRENYTTEELAGQFNIVKAVPFESGSVFISLTPEQTTLLEQRDYVYDLLLIDESKSPPYVRRMLEGRFTIRPAVTRDY
jgi:hypothetical protein